MTIVAARRYREGKVVKAALGPRAGKPREGEFDWIGLVDPTPAEMERMRKAYGLHPLAIEDALTVRHPPKAESYGEQLFVIARTVESGVGDLIIYAQTAMFLSRDFIVTVRLGSARAHLELRDQLEAIPERLREGPDVVLHALLDFIAEGYEPVLDKLEAIVAQVEDGAIEAFPDDSRIRRIFRLRRGLRQLEGTGGRMEEMAAKLAQVELPAIDAKARPYFRDVHDDTRRVVSRVRALIDTLGSILEVASLLEQSRQGVITRQLAAWAAILAVPTAIAGIYGMNFDFMPELEWRYGYFYVLGGLALVCGGLFIRFRKIGWL
jgi:magnesium transporter